MSKAIPQIDIPTLPARDQPLFDAGATTVVFVLGGPGSGKGTQSDRIVRDYGFRHLSAGDLLREEQERAGSQFGDLIRALIPIGQIVPMEITIQLLENAMVRAEKEDGITKFLIDGFPRKMDQGVAFEKTVCRSSFVLFFEADEDVLEQRLLNRGKSSGRTDDNIESIRKRFAVFKSTTMPVVDAFESQGKVEKVDANGDLDQIYADVQKRFEKRGISKSS